MLLAWFELVSMPPRVWAKRTPSGSTDKMSGQNCRTWPSGTLVKTAVAAQSLTVTRIKPQLSFLIQRPHFQRPDGGVDTRSSGCPTQIHCHIPPSLHSQNGRHEAHHTSHGCRCQNKGTVLISLNVSFSCPHAEMRSHQRNI